MKYIIKLYLLSLILIATPMIAMDGVAVIDMRTAVLSTQAAADAFKALEEDPDYSSNLEEAKSIQADRQAMAEKLQKDFETLSQEQVAEMQRDIQEKGQDLEFLAGKIQQAQEETAAKIFNETGPAMQKIIGELIAACCIIITVFFGGEEGISGDRTMAPPTFGVEFISQKEVYFLIAFWVFVSTFLMYLFTHSSYSKFPNNFLLHT